MADAAEARLGFRVCLRQPEVADHLGPLLVCPIPALRVCFQAFYSSAVGLQKLCEQGILRESGQILLICGKGELVIRVMLILRSFRREP
mgnify:CR=1 FL=1